MSMLPAELATGIRLIDQQHGELLYTLDHLTDEGALKPHSDEFLEAFSHLGSMLIKHFQDEEEVFTSGGMPVHDAFEHIAAHTRIIEQYAEINFDVMSQKPDALGSLASLLKRWIIDHLLEYDLKIHGNPLRDPRA